MKKIFSVLAVAMFLIGCGSKENVSSKEAGVVPGQKDYVKEGIQYLQQANLTAAIKSFDAAIKQNPKDSRAYTILGETYMRMKQYDRAQDILTMATKVAPTDGDAYYLLAVNAGLSGKPEEAKINVQKSIVLYQKAKDGENLKKSLVLFQGLTSVQ